MRGRRATTLEVGDDELEQLKRIAGDRSGVFWHVQLARVLLARTTARRVCDVARENGVDPATVWRMTQRFRLYGMAAFAEPESSERFVVGPSCVSPWAAATN